MPIFDLLDTPNWWPPWFPAFPSPKSSSLASQSFAGAPVMLAMVSQHGVPMGPQNAGKIWICIWYMTLFKHARIWGVNSFKTFLFHVCVSCICLKRYFSRFWNPKISKYTIWVACGISTTRPPETSVGPSPTSAWRHLHLWQGVEPAPFWPVSDRPSIHHS